MMDDLLTKATTKRRNLNDIEIYKGMGLLHEHLRSTDKPDEWFYADHYSDQRLADMIGCTLNNIVGLRERAFGKLIKAPAVIRDPRVDELVAKHNGFVRDMTIRFKIDPSLVASYLMEELR